MNLIPFFKRRLAVAAAVSTLLLSACGGGSGSDAAEPVCAAGTYCSVKLRVDLSGLTTANQQVQLRLVPIGRADDTSISTQALSCSSLLCRPTVSQNNLAPGYYRLNALSEQGQFLGSGVFEIGLGDDDGVLHVDTTLDMESTGYYAAGLLTQGLDAVRAYELLAQLNVLTGANSDSVTEMQALGRYFMAQGGQDPARHAQIVAQLRADVDQGRAPYEDGALEGADIAGAAIQVSTGGIGAKLVTGPLGFGASFVLRGFVKSDAFKDDPLQASLHLFKVALGMSTDVKRLFSSGGEVRSALSKIDARLANQTALMVGLNDELTRFQQIYKDNYLLDKQGDFYSSIKALEAVRTPLSQLSENHLGCITLSNGATPAMPGLGGRQYLELFITQPQNDPSGLRRQYNLACLSDKLAEIYTRSNTLTLQAHHSALTDDAKAESLTGKLLKALKGATVRYPSNALRGRPDAQVRLLSDSYALYNAMMAKHLVDLAGATATYADFYDVLFYAREQFPELRSRLYAGELLTSDLPDSYNQAAHAQPGANACHGENGQFFDLSRASVELQMRCRFEMIMGYRATRVSAIPLLAFNNDADLLRTLPEGHWRDQCKVTGLNVPDGPVVLDYDGVNLWTFCPADDKVANLPRELIGALAHYQSRNQLSFRGLYAEMINCSALRQVKDYADTVWPKYLEGRDDTGAVAIACSMQDIDKPSAERKSNWAVGHINLARCGVDGSTPARIGVDDGVLQCQDKAEGQGYWNKYKQRLTANDTSGLLRWQFGSRSGVLGFNAAGGSRSMIAASDRRTSLTDRRRTDFGRRFDWRRSITEDGRAMLFDMDSKALSSPDYGDIWMQEFRYHRVLEVPQTSFMHASFSGRALSDQEANELKSRNQRTLPLMVYRRFAIGMGVRFDRFLGVRVEQSFSTYLRCPEDDAGCKMETVGSNDNRNERNTHIQLTFGNSFWGPIKLRRYDNEALFGDVTVPGYVNEAESTHAYLTVGRD